MSETERPIGNRESRAIARNKAAEKNERERGGGGKPGEAAKIEREKGENSGGEDRQMRPGILNWTHAQVIVKGSTFAAAFIGPGIYVTQSCIVTHSSTAQSFAQAYCIC